MKKLTIIVELMNGEVITKHITTTGEYIHPDTINQVVENIEEFEDIEKIHIDIEF